LIQEELYKKLALACFPGQRDRLGSLTTIVKLGLGAQGPMSRLHQFGEAVHTQLGPLAQSTSTKLLTLGPFANSTSTKMLAAAVDVSCTSNSVDMADHTEDGGSHDASVGAVSGTGPREQQLAI
jgi:hypothetical protein